MHFGVVDHIRASALTTADRRPPSWNRITDSTHAPSVENGIGEPHCLKNVLYLTMDNDVTAYRMAKRAVVVVNIWWLDLQLPMHSVPITTNVVSSNPAHAKCTRYNAM